MKRKVVPIVTMFLFLLFVPLSYATERAGNRVIIHELKFGLLGHDVDNLWSASKREQGADVNIEAIFSLSYRILGGDIRPVLGASINTHGYTSKLYLDGIWRYYVTDALYGAFGLGFAIHNGEKHLVSRDQKALGSRLLFHIPMEIGYRLDEQYSFSLFFDHMSNGYLVEPNEGLDTLGFRIGYMF